MSTKIFRVEFETTETLNGKKSQPFRNSKNVVAKNGQDAIIKVEKSLQKPYSFKDEETGKLIKCQYVGMNVISLSLIAEAE